MALVYVVFSDYPRSGGRVTFNFINPQGQVFYTQYHDLEIPNPEWEWWYSFAWAVAGKFDKNSGFSGDEIITPGKYKVEVLSPFGNAMIDFDVTGQPAQTPPPASGGSECYKGVTINLTPYPPFPEYTVWIGFQGNSLAFLSVADAKAYIDSYIFGETQCGVTNMITINIGKVGNGTGKVLSSGGDNALSERSSITVPYGYKVYFYAEPGQDSEFVRWVDGGYSVTDNPLEIPIIEPGNINAEFKLKGSTGTECPKGEKYLANGWEVWTGCPDGYTIRKGGELGLPFVDDYYCVCQTGEAGKDNEGWVKYVPYAIGAYLLSSLFGGKR